MIYGTKAQKSSLSIPQINVDYKSNFVVYVMPDCTQYIDGWMCWPIAAG